LVASWVLSSVEPKVGMKVVKKVVSMVAMKAD